MLTAMAIVICVVSNELYKRGTEDFPPNAPGWMKSISIVLLSTRPITLLTNFNNQVIYYKLYTVTRYTNSTQVLYF